MPFCDRLTLSGCSEELAPLSERVRVRFQHPQSGRPLQPDAGADVDYCPDALRGYDTGFGVGPELSSRPALALYRLSRFRLGVHHAVQKRVECILVYLHYVPPGGA